LPEPAENFSRSWGTQSPGVVSPRPAYQRPLDPIYPTSPNDVPFAPLGPQSQNGVAPFMQSSSGADVAPATVIDPQTFMMPPVIVDQRKPTNNNSRGHRGSTRN
jgi:hypothetical protein